jgi:hypothetical protein
MTHTAMLLADDLGAQYRGLKYRFNFSMRQGFMMRMGILERFFSLQHVSLQAMKKHHHGD